MSRYGYSWGGFTYRPKVNPNQYIKKHRDLKPISISGREMARTFWGKHWCEHFEGMADYDNRLSRGRTYARNGSILHLDIGPGQIKAVVCGSDFYDIIMTVAPLSKERWDSILDKCRGRISTVMDLLAGRFSSEVMEVLCHPTEGMFPLESEIDFKCSCPDWAHLCKHVASVFYGIGNRLDSSPEYLFLLRRVDPTELLTGSVDSLLSAASVETEDDLTGDLGAIFGVEVDLAGDKPLPQPAASKKKPGPKPTAKTTAAKVEKKDQKAKPIASSATKLSDEALIKVIEQMSQTRAATGTIRGYGTLTIPDFDNLKGEDILGLRVYCGLDLDEMAAEIGVSSACLRRWELIKGPLKISIKSMDLLKGWTKRISQ
ncbi:MAG: hypothetical protein LBT47_13555 [Deltaproteobacteria bacterium]|jgi:uncharacterized Zn finger protein|nr:hypothetical protein [Deltaproteobacteria bacterium]